MQEKDTKVWNAFASSVNNEAGYSGHILTLGYLVTEENAALFRFKKHPCEGKHRDKIEIRWRNHSAAFWRAKGFAYPSKCLLKGINLMSGICWHLMKGMSSNA